MQHISCESGRALEKYPKILVVPDGPGRDEVASAVVQWHGLTLHADLACLEREGLEPGGGGTRYYKGFAPLPLLILQGIFLAPF